MSSETVDTTVLRPYLPRLVLDWVHDEAATRWKAIDGTFVFADLSGFTKMSERLARLGRLGAEEVTESIGTCFAELLEIVYEDGGGLVKFGGDALFLLFTGEDHVVRAARSAAGMRTRLRTAGKFVTPAGNVTLRMSVGVHTDTFHCFLVGGSSRELIVVGEAASTVVAMEGAATAGRIVLSPDTAAALPDRSHGAPFGPGVLLSRAPKGTPPAGLPPIPPLAGIDLGAYVPTEVRAHALGGGQEPEHRTVTVAFVHFDGVDAFLAQHGPERTADALEELVTTVQDACEQHGVALLATDVDGDGGKLMLASGAPRALGQAEERMLATAMRVVDAGTELPVRIGVHRGPVFAGDVGPQYRRTYTVMGDTVNMAARLMGKANPGQIITTADVLDRSPTFAAEALPPMQLKGKRAPVHAFSVVGARRARAGAVTGSGHQLPFVGRDAEMHTLDVMLTAARAGAGAVVEIVGAPGIGKSRLVAELEAQASDFRALVVTCEPYESSTPYAALWWLLHRVLDLPEDATPEAITTQLTAAVRADAPHLEPWLPLLGGLLDLGLPDTEETATLAPRFRRERTAEATAAFLDARLTRPTILVFEDTQWIDQASRELVELLVTKTEGVPWVVACTRIADSPPIGEAITLELGPLSEHASVEALVRATEDAPLLPHQMEALTSRAEGNPLFLTELLRVVRDSSTDGTPDDGSLPDSIDALVTAQIDRLAPAHRRLLRYAAVLGRSFSLRDLEALLSGELAVPDARTWAELADFVEVESSTRARFRHALIRDTAYEELSYRRRRELHGRAARMLEHTLDDRVETEAEVLSFHFFTAQAYPDAWRYACLAGRRACDKYANVDAAALFERALAAAKRLPELPAHTTAEVWELLGDVRERSGVYDGAVAAYRAARRLVHDDPVHEAGLFLKEAWIPERTGRYSESIRWIRKGLNLLEGIPGPVAGRCRAQLASWFGMIRQAQGRAAEAITWCERAITEAVAADDPEAEAHACLTLDWAYVRLGQRDRAVYSARALELYEGLGDLSGQAGVLNNLGVFAYWRGQWEEAVGYYERSRDLELRTGDVINAATAGANIAEVLADQGHLDDAEEKLLDALRVFRASRYGYMIGFSCSVLGRVASRRGDFGDAFERFDEARREFAAAELPADGVHVDALYAHALVLAGDPEGGLALAEETQARDDDGSEEPLLLRIRGYALAQQGAHDEAVAALQAGLTSAREQEAEYEVALTLDAIARLTDDPEAAAERTVILTRLGVRQVPEVPLARRAQ